MVISSIDLSFPLSPFIQCPSMHPIPLAIHRVIPIDPYLPSPPIHYASSLFRFLPSPPIHYVSSLFFAMCPWHTFIFLPSPLFAVCPSLLSPPMYLISTTSSHSQCLPSLYRMANTTELMASLEPAISPTQQRDKR